MWIITNTERKEMWTYSELRGRSTNAAVVSAEAPLYSSHTSTRHHGLCLWGEVRAQHRCGRGWKIIYICSQLLIVIQNRRASLTCLSIVTETVFSGFHVNVESNDIWGFKETQGVVLRCKWQASKWYNDQEVQIPLQPHKYRFSRSLQGFVHCRPHFCF